MPYSVTKFATLASRVGAGRLSERFRLGSVEVANAIFIRYEELTGRTFHVVYDETIRTVAFVNSRSLLGLRNRAQKDASFGAGAQ